MYLAGSAAELELTRPLAERPGARRAVLPGDCSRDPVYSPRSARADRERRVHGQTGTADLEALEHLLCASGNGDRAAFAEVYRLTAARLFPIALRLLRGREAAEDVLQESYVLIWRKAAQFHPGRGRPLPWMAAIVRNRAIDRLRAQAREPQDPAQWDDLAEGLADPAASASAAAAPDAVAVRGCLERLQENQRQAILLAYYGGMTHEELSARLDAPLGTVKSWVRRGLLQLKDCLDA